MKHLVLTSRRALTQLEFLCCLVAVFGGIWLGAVYFGVDMRHVAHTALTETELLDKVPPEWRPLGPQDGVTREQLVATLREELGSLKTEIATLHSGEAAPAAPEPGTDGALKLSGTSQPTQEQTLAYWSRLNEIALGEAALQADAESASGDTNAAKAFAIKSRIGRFAAKAVEAIPDSQVDPAVLQFGRNLKQWYENGADLYDKAVQIWESSTNDLGREQLNQDWRRSELQRKNKAQLLREKAVSVRLAINRKYGLEVPAFADLKNAQESGKEIHLAPTE